MNTALEAIAAALRAHQRFVVLTHVHPDGDALGSALALTRALRSLDKDACLWHAEGVPTSYGFLAGDWSEHPPADIARRVAIAVDCGDRSRVADTLPDGAGLLEQALLSIQLDHHDTNPGFASLNYVRSDLPATAQLLPELLNLLGVELTEEIARPLYVGLYTDTGGFRFRSVTEETFALKERLGRSTDLAVIEGHLLDYPKSTLRYAERARSRIRLIAEGVACTVMTREDVLECGVAEAELQEADSLAKLWLQDAEAILYLYVCERHDGARHASIRCPSEVVHAGELARLFGGGGHRAAAGLNTQLASEDLIRAVLVAYQQARSGSAPVTTG